jgi:hypothetical protein
MEDYAVHLGMVAQECGIYELNISVDVVGQVGVVQMHDGRAVISRRSTRVYLLGYYQF